MTDFGDFARACGLLVERIQADGRLHRVPTVDKPRSDNGRYRFNGFSGWARDMRSSAGTQFFKSDREPSPMQAAAIAQRANSERGRLDADYKAAAAKAKEVLARCTYDSHQYLAKKGLWEARGLVDTDSRLVVPMRNWNTSDLQSVQWIDREGGKKFLTGGRARGAVFAIGPRTGPAWYCEGYATGLTVVEALKALFRPDRVVVCFSAQNMKWVASESPGVRFVVADNDVSGTGQDAAAATGLPWVMSPVEGEDLNDLYQRTDEIKAVANLLRGVLTKR